MLEKDKNPDVMWVTRTVTVMTVNNAVREVTGLFACYRPQSAGAPVCHLAKFDGSDADLGWPGGLYLNEQGMLSRIGSDSPVTMPTARR